LQGVGEAGGTAVFSPIEGCLRKISLAMRPGKGTKWGEKRYPAPWMTLPQQVL
jgi:hypothetical protein